MSATMGIGAIAIADRGSGGVPVRCSGCGWSDAEVGPAVAFVSFGQQLFRGVIVEASAAAAAVERIEDLVLCGECLAAAFLLDPLVARTARERLAEERRRLAEDAKHFSKRDAEVRRAIRAEERRLAQLEAARKERDEVRAAAAKLCPEFDAIAEEFRAARLRVWALSRLAEGDKSEEAQQELADASEQFDKLRRSLRALTVAGSRLKQQCEDKGLAAERDALRDRLAVDLDPDPQSRRTR